MPSLTVTAAAVMLQALLASAQPAPVPRAKPVMSCDAVASLALPDGKVTSATEVGSDPTRGIHAPHCKVGGVIGTEIHFEVLLPDAWNFSFLMGGGGGFVEGVANDQASSVDDGYASAGTDTGHQSSGLQASWALNNHERQINYGHLGIHRTAVTARAIIAAYYGTAPRHAYFAGCSNGGRQALMEAQRYPDDFDGIVAGAPAYDFTNHRRGVPEEHPRRVSHARHATRAADDAGAGGEGRPRRLRRGRRRHGWAHRRPGELSRAARSDQDVRPGRRRRLHHAGRTRRHRQDLRARGSGFW